MWSLDGFGGFEINTVANMSCFLDHEESLGLLYKSVRSLKINILENYGWQQDLKTPDPGCAYGYKACEFRGPRIEFCGDFNQFDKEFDNEISSFKLGSMSRILLFDDKDFKGPNSEFRTSVSCFLDDIDPNVQFWHNKPSACIVERQIPEFCALLFPDVKWRKDPTQICPKDTDLLVKSKLIDSFKSIRMGKNAKIQIFSDQNNSDYTELSDNIENMSDTTQKLISTMFGNISIRALDK